MTRPEQRWLVIAAMVLLLVVTLAVAYVTIPAVEDALDTVGVRVRNVGDVVNPALAARADIVGEILGRIVPAETPARADFIGACMSVFRNESGFVADVFNYYARNDDGSYALNPVTGKKMLRKDNGTDSPNFRYAHAKGICQIVYHADVGLTAEQCLDAESNLAASLRRYNLPAWSKIMAAVPEADLQMRAALLYMGHGRGPSTVPLAVATAAESGDWGAVSAAVLAKFGSGGLNFSKMWACAARARDYADTYGGA